MFERDPVFEMPKSLIDSLKKDFRLPDNTKPETVLRKTLAVAGFMAENGVLIFKDGKTIVKVGNTELDLDVIN